MILQTINNKVKRGQMQAAGERKMSKSIERDIGLFYGTIVALPYGAHGIGTEFIFWLA